MLLKRRKPILAALLSALLIVLLSACGNETDGEEAPLPDIPEEESAVHSSYAADNVFSLNCDKDYTFNPFSTTNISNILCTQIMYDTLFDVDESFVATPGLIKSFSSDDGKCWRFNVDTSVKFWDGSTLTAQDAAYSIQRAMRSPQFKARLSVIMGASSMDESLFIINLYDANTQFPSLLTIPVIKYGTVGDAAPMGTGPYMPNEELTELNAFSGHKNYLQMPADTIYLKEFKEVESVITAFENSEIDLVTNDPTGFFNLGYGTANEIRNYPTTNMHYLGFNSTSRFFSSAMCRKAMTYVIDREHVVTDIMGGAGSAATLPMSPASPYYNDRYSEIISYSVKKSEAAFNEANVQDYDDDGYREIMITGIQVESDTDFIVCNDSSVKVAAARAIAQNMENLGIKVTLRELSWDDYIYALNHGEFDMYYAETKLTADFSLRSLLIEGGALNYGKYSDPVMAENINAYMSSTEENRQTAANLMFKYITDTAPIVPICFEKQQAITHRGIVSGLKPTQFNIFRGIENWEITMD